MYKCRIEKYNKNNDNEINNSIDAMNNIKQISPNDEDRPCNYFKNTTRLIICQSRTLLYMIIKDKLCQ